MSTSSTHWPVGAPQQEDDELTYTYSKTDLAVPSSRVGGAGSPVGGGGNNSNFNNSDSLAASLNGRVAPPERIPGRKTAAPSAVAPTVPSSRPNTPRGTPRETFAAEDGNPDLLARSSSTVGPAVNRGPAVPPIRPPTRSTTATPNNSPALQPTSATSAANAATATSGSKKPIAPPAARPSPSLSASNAEGTNTAAAFATPSAAVTPSTSVANYGNNNAASSNNASFGARTTSRGNSEAPAATAVTFTAAPITSSSSPTNANNGSATVAANKSNNGGVTVTYQQQNNNDDDDDEFSANGPRVNVNPSARRSGYEAALASASVRSRSEERREKEQQQQQNGGHGLVAANNSAKLVSPSRDMFGALNTIDRRHLNPTPKCERLFHYEEPVAVGVANRDALVWDRPAHAAMVNNNNGNGNSGSKIRRGGDHFYDNSYMPAPVGTTLYEFASASQERRRRQEQETEEPYEGRNDLVRQLREFELRQAHQEDLRSFTRGGGNSDAHHSNYNAVSSFYGGGNVNNNSISAASYAANPNASQSNNYYDAMYGHQRDFSGNGNGTPTRGGGNSYINNNASAVRRQQNQQGPMPSYGSTYTEHVSTGEKIVRSFPSEWRVGAFPSSAAAGGGRSQSNAAMGGSGNSAPLHTSSAHLSRQQSIDRYGAAAGRGRSGSSLHHDGGVIAYRTPM